MDGLRKSLQETTRLRTLMLQRIHPISCSCPTHVFHASRPAQVDGLRKSLQETGKSYASQASKAANKAAAIQVGRQGFKGHNSHFCPP